MDPTSTVLIGALIAIILKDFFMSPKNDIKELKVEMKSLTVALVKLESTISHHKEKVDMIPKLEKDVNAAHEKLRSL